MSKKKGLSMEEKVQRVEEWFVAHPSPYTLKEILAAVPKSTGVIPQSIEECLEILVSEDRVSQKKIGINVLFWRFPKTAAQQLAATFKGRSGGAAEAAKYLSMTVPQIQAEISSLSKKEAEASKRIKEMRSLLGDVDAMQRDEERVVELQKESRALRAQLEQLAIFDPETLARIASSTAVALEAANRWTDNIYLLEHNIAQRVGMNPRELRSQLQLPAVIDYIELDDLMCAPASKQSNALRSAASPPPREETPVEESCAEPAAAAEQKQERHSPDAAMVGEGRKRMKCDDDKVDDSTEENAKSAAASRRRRPKKEA